MMLPHLSDCVEVLQHVWRVGHPEPQHDTPVLGQLRRHVPQQRRDVGAEVPPVGARVLTAQPDLPHLGGARLWEWVMEQMDQR